MYQLFQEVFEPQIKIIFIKMMDNSIWLRIPNELQLVEKSEIVKRSQDPNYLKVEMENLLLAFERLEKPNVTKRRPINTALDGM
ncbi:hypothetical protein [Aequorivita capsosiphonis]|uniref:hypothetical protein n=1 Tax=Aequorivita capsosiphonis TaxID=487317 RepID=UPI00047E2884|nr:hypothetical protein [Aequorivita capsosiphonis]